MASARRFLLTRFNQAWAVSMTLAWMSASGRIQPFPPQAIASPIPVGTSIIATRRTTISPTANRNSCGLSSADSFFGIWCWRVLCCWPSPQPSPARGKGRRACLVGRAPRSGAAWSDVYPPLAPGIWNSAPSPGNQKHRKRALNDFRFAPKPSKAVSSHPTAAEAALRLSLRNG